MKKRRISFLKVVNHADLPKVLEWLRTTHTKDIMDTGHFDRVLIFPSDTEPDYIAVILIAKSVEHCDKYEAENLPTIGKSFVEELITPGLVEALFKFSSTEQ